MRIRTVGGAQAPRGLKAALQRIGICGFTFFGAAAGAEFSGGHGGLTVARRRIRVERQRWLNRV